MQKKYVILVGGQLYNKGAQSMVFTVVNEMKNRFPGYEVIMFSNFDYTRSQKEQDNYKFSISKHPKIMTSLAFSHNIFKIFLKNKKVIKKEIIKYEKLFKNTVLMLDISGYALGSNWGNKKCFMYVNRIKIAKRYKIPVYLLPQSFGPFQFKGMLRPFINKYIRRHLRYPEVIYAREQEGYDLLINKYKLKNIKIAHDIVLSSSEINKKNIYYKPENTQTRLYNVKNDSVAIVPNMKNFQYGNRNDVIEHYIRIIRRLLKNKTSIYLIRHSYEDIEACHLIKKEFEENTNVTLINDDLSCFDFERIIMEFNFIIASRYHSIIHAYKNGTPCIAIGWATKYHELLKTFKQEDYIFDVRKNMDTNSIVEAVDKMLEKYQEESDTILEILEEVQGENVFDIIGGEK